nr:hypothetical protein Itr_chr08CG08550 [Ipomoea trifida]
MEFEMPCLSLFHDESKKKLQRNQGFNICRGNVQGQAKLTFRCHVCLVLRMHKCLFPFAGDLAYAMVILENLLHIYQNQHVKKYYCS